MRIALGADERNHVTDYLIRELRKRGHQLIRETQLRRQRVHTLFELLLNHWYGVR